MGYIMVYIIMYISHIYIYLNNIQWLIYIYILVRTPPNINLWKIIVVSRWAAAGAKWRPQRRFSRGTSRPCAFAAKGVRAGSDGIIPGCGWLMLMVSFDGFDAVNQGKLWSTNCNWVTDRKKWSIPQIVAAWLVLLFLLCIDMYCIYFPSLLSP